LGRFGVRGIGEGAVEMAGAAPTAALLGSVRLSLRRKKRKEKKDRPVLGIRTGLRGGRGPPGRRCVVVAGAVSVVA